MSTAEAGHPAWCDPQHCSVTDEKVRVHEQAPTRWEDDTAGLQVRFESRLLDPGGDDTTSLELPLRNLKIRDEFSALLPLDAARRLRDQLTEHLDAAETTRGSVR
jgi:hypothetical protein